jgi:hypothetical protein
MNIKSIIKIIMPSLLLNWVKTIQYKKACNACYNYDATRFTQYSNSLNKWDTSEKLIGQIIAEYHVIEKGLAMFDMRLGFGKEILNDLIRHCEQYALRFDKKNEQFLYALRVIAEYKFEHEINDYTIENDLLQAINNLFSNYKGVIPSKQIAMTKEDYFRYSESAFDYFSNSRRSLRNFSGKIEIARIEKAIRLAQNTPTSCNRQQQRLYIIQNKKRIEQVLKIQTGNRGFGHLADKLIILTAELGGFIGLNERNDLYVNGGIYAMNLLYALHYYQIGSCALNWCSMPEQDLELRKICEILPSETVILIIACGGVPDKFKLVRSHRNNYSAILKII